MGKAPQNKTLLCLANFSSEAGYAWWLMERFWALLANYVTSAGWRVIVAFPKIENVSETLRSAPLSVIELSFPTKDWLPKRDILNFIRRQAVTAVYLTDRSLWSPAYFWFRKFGVELIIVHDHIPGERPPVPKWKFYLKRTRFFFPGPRADLYIGVSKFVRDRFIRIGGVPPRLCTYVRNGVTYINISQAKNIREEYGLPKGARVVVSVGRAHLYKGIDFIISCAQDLIVKKRMKDLYFIHFGDGPHLNRFIDTVQSFGITEYFLFAGTRNDLREYLPSCDVAFHASKGEAFSLAVLEFMMAGLPAVIPDHCGNGEAIIHEDSGLLYPPNSQSEAVKYLTLLLNNIEYRKEMGQNAAIRARTKFSIEEMDRQFLETITPFLPL